MRQERLVRLRQRHMQRHHAQQTIGVREPQGVQKDFNQKSMVRLHRSASAASSLEQRQYLEPSPGAEDGADASFYSEAQASGQRGLSSSSSMDLLAQIAPVGEICMLKKAPRAMMYRGMEGLCLPKYPILATTESRASTSTLGGSPSRASMGGTMGSLATRPGSSPGGARGGLGSNRSAPVLGWAEPAGLIPHGRTAPMHFETGLSPAPLSRPSSGISRPGPSPTNLSRPSTSGLSRPSSGLSPSPSPAKRPASREALERAARALA